MGQLVAIKVDYNNLYYIGCGCLWILPPKNGSTSIRKAIRADNYLSREEAEKLNKKHTTIGVVRHPYDRAVSALWTVLMTSGRQQETLEREITNSHLRPQYPAFEGLRVDHILRTETLGEDWGRLKKWIVLPELQHINKGSTTNGRPKRWRDAPIDWTPVTALYKQDMDLWQIASIHR